MSDPKSGLGSNRQLHEKKTLGSATNLVYLMFNAVEFVRMRQGHQDKITRKAFQLSPFVQTFQGQTPKSMLANNPPAALDVEK